MSDKQSLPTGLQLTAADPVFRERPHEYLDRLRTEDPVHCDVELGRLLLTRFEDARAVVSNRSLSVDPRKAPPGSYLRRILVANEPIEVFEPSMLSLDDPDHKRIRGLVSQAFNQRAVDAVRPRIRAIAEELLDALIGRNSFDVIADPPAVQTTRVALESLETGGTEVQAGEVMTVSLRAAGHDPVRHSNPHRFDVERADASHFAFGGGAHFCLRAPLARAEAQIAIPVLFERFPGLCLDPQHAQGRGVDQPRRARSRGARDRSPRREGPGAQALAP
jgi:cytochrome P450